MLKPGRMRLLACPPSCYFRASLARGHPRPFVFTAMEKDQRLLSKLLALATIEIHKRAEHAEEDEI